MDQLFSASEVCQMLKVSPRTLRRLVAAGDFPPPRRLYPNGINRWTQTALNQVFSDMAIADAYKDSGYYEKHAQHA